MASSGLGFPAAHTLCMSVGSGVFNAARLAPALPLGGGGVLAIAAAFSTWWLLPREAPASDGVEAADRLPIRPGEVAGWTGTVDLPAWFVSLVAGVAAALIVLGVLLLLTAGGKVWPIFLSPALLLVVLLVTAQFV